MKTNFNFIVISFTIIILPSAADIIKIMQMYWIVSPLDDEVTKQSDQGSIDGGRMELGRH